MQLEFARRMDVLVRLSLLRLVERTWTSILKARYAWLFFDYGVSTVTAITIGADESSPLINSTFSMILSVSGVTAR